MSLSDLEDLNYEDGKLSFTRASRNREGQTTTSKFTGTIQDGKLTGTMSGDGSVFNALMRYNTLSAVGIALTIWSRFLEDDMVKTSTISSKFNRQESKVQPLTPQAAVLRRNDSNS